MLTARVTGYRGDRLLADVPRQRACARCLDGRGCGMGLLGSRRTDTVTVEVEAPAERPAPGSTVSLSGAPGVVGAALLGYGLPLAGLLAGAVSGPALSLAGLAAGMMSSRWLLRGRVRWHVVADAVPP